ncbi:MAG: helix-hairpin-helix domain-containing protein [Deltaproteobacteria bacterium]|nr:helix-hairpin-helix domain-containing protein [Deltaproteobacteria bacterium]
MDKVKELLKIKGVGAVTAEKLVAAGFDSPAKIAGAAAEELQAVPGLRGNLIPSLQEEAGKVAEGKTSKTEVSPESLLLQIEHLKMLLEGLEADIHTHFPAGGEEKQPKKQVKEVHRFLGTLDRVETALAEQLQSFSKRLTKAGARLSNIREGGLEGLRDGLKQARKDLEKILD